MYRSRYDNDEREGLRYEDFLRWKRKEEAARVSRRYADYDDQDDYRGGRRSRVVTKTSYALGYDDSDDDERGRGRVVIENKRYYDDEDEREYRRPRSKSGGRKGRRYDEHEDEEDEEEEERRRSSRRVGTTKQRSKSQSSKSGKRSSRRSGSQKKKAAREDDESEEEQQVQRKKSSKRREEEESDEVERKKKGNKRREEEDSDEPVQRKKSNTTPPKRKEKKVKEAEGDSDEPQQKKQSKKSKNEDSSEPEEKEGGAFEEESFSFDHIKWLDYWVNTYSADTPSEKKRSKLKKLLSMVVESTEKVCQDRNYVVAVREGENKPCSLDKSSLKDAIKNVRTYLPQDLEKYSKPAPKGEKTTAHLVKADLLEVALYVKHEIHKNPLVLVSVDPKIPGGRDKQALYGQEVTVWRRTSISHHLDPNLRSHYVKNDDFDYRIAKNAAVYVPDVYIFREAEKKGYQLREPDTLSFICIPPINNRNATAKSDAQRKPLSEKDKQSLRTKIHLVFQVALAHGHDSVVLSPFGCGYARNDPSEVAQVFIEVIKDYSRVFSNIVFAVTDNPNSFECGSKGNIAAFEDAFTNLEKKKKK